jgi:chemotaxis protein methyltransferase CheR
MDIAISDQEFRQFQALLARIAGIHLAAGKKALVSGRLAKRLRHWQLASFGDYYRLIIGSEPGELKLAIDLLTTNETYFFREPKHFALLRDGVLPALQGPPRIWSAACSSGEEPYTLAMVLHDALGEARWEILASDLSERMLERARTAHYPMARGRDIPPALLRRHCLKGIGRQDGTFLVGRPLRARVEFRPINLNAPLPEIGLFDVIFLRNVLIYFDLEMKRQVVARVASRLKPGGWLFIGHSESLNGVCDDLQQQMPTVYRRLP